MRRLLVLTSAFLITAGMAVAQDSNPSTMSSSQQPSANSNSLRGCLTAGGDQFKLTTDVGAKVVNLSVDKNSASPYVAHEVEVQGSTGSDGNFRVDRILDLADHCGQTGQATTADNSSASQSSSVASPSTTTTTPDNSSSASTAAPSSSSSMSSSQTSPSSTTAPTTTSPDTTAAANPPATTTTG